jgi:hypothetical protein
MPKSGSGRARSATSGRFVKKTTAAKNPRTTVVESTKTTKRKKG